MYGNQKRIRIDVNERLMPVMQEAKVPAPDVEIFQINDVVAYPGIEKYRIR